jgi:TetR/AcrR family transcriptional regulator, cholesterol catabolism regulator
MEVKDKIVTEALILFTKYGIRSITMDMIAEHLGISKRTIYENFKDKDELLRFCLEAAVVQQKDKTEDILNSSETIIEIMIKIVKHNVGVLKSVNPLFYYDIKKYYPELSKLTIEKSDKEYIERIVELLNRGLQENLFRSGINVEIVAILLFEQFKTLNNQEVFPEEKFSKAEIFENIVINFMRGIATVEGLSLIEKYNY